MRAIISSDRSLIVERLTGNTVAGANAAIPYSALAVDGNAGAVQH
jgi:hypothetical protein